VETAVLEALGLGFSAEDIEKAFTLRLAGWRQHRAESAGKKLLAPTQASQTIRFVGSHDLAVELLASHLCTLHPDIQFSSTFVGSLAGLVALECGEADIAGSHLLDEDSGQFNIPFIKRLMPNETVVLINLMQRVQGLMVTPGNPKHILGITDLKRPDIVFVNRQKGSGTRIFLDSQLLRLGIMPAEVKGYGHEEKTHVAVASLIAQGRADVGLGAQSAANLAGLDFIPLLRERYDLIALQNDFESPLFHNVKEVVCSQGFRNMLGSIAGYDVSETGRLVTLNPKQVKDEARNELV
jgi:putative molybdopterin biosynthesis protein